MTPRDLVDQLRALGLPMLARYASGHRLTWTTDEAKATAASKLGATVVPYQSSDPRFSGWEVSARDTA
jgi:hypothetical protein